MRYSGRPNALAIVPAAAVLAGAALSPSPAAAFAIHGHWLSDHHHIRLSLNTDLVESCTVAAGVNYDVSTRLAMATWNDALSEVLPPPSGGLYLDQDDDVLTCGNLVDFKNTISFGDCLDQLLPDAQATAFHTTIAEPYRRNGTVIDGVYVDADIVFCSSDNPACGA